jgi:hypothetical protein
MWFMVTEAQEAPQVYMITITMFQERDRKQHRIQAVVEMILAEE